MCAAPSLETWWSAKGLGSDLLGLTKRFFIHVQNWRVLGASLRYNGRVSARLFQELYQSAPLLVPTVWDCASAMIAERCGANAVATSSAAMAWALGCADGNVVSPDLICASIERITKRLGVPLSVDLEGGYSDSPDEVALLASRMLELGVAGINLEDGTGAPQKLEAKIRRVRERCKDRLFVNARTDVYLNGATGPDALREVRGRARLYRDAGAHGLFVPGLKDLATIAKICAATPMFVHVMSELPVQDLAELKAAGVARISLGPSLFFSAYRTVAEALDNSLQTERGQMLMNYEEMNRLFGG